MALLRDCDDLAALGEAADAVCRRLHPEPFRTYNIDRNINYTNICVAGCKFCAFARRPGHEEGYVLDEDVLFAKIAETVELGGDQILLQGGHHPGLSFDWHLTLINRIKRKFPRINIHAYSPPEIVFFSHNTGLSIRAVLQKLIAAGLGSLPGGGAEILVDRVRRKISPAKCSAHEWIEVMRTAHALGLRSSATMMFGHLERVADRIEHLLKIRDLQDETGGFTAFIPWTFQPGHTALGCVPPAGAVDYLRTLAVSRIFLDNFRNMQASWVTQGPRIAQTALHFGANDMGSIMIEENVVAAAGTCFSLSEPEMRRLIVESGFQPRKRDFWYGLSD